MPRKFSMRTEWMGAIKFCAGPRGRWVWSWLVALLGPGHPICPSPVIDHGQIGTTVHLRTVPEGVLPTRPEPNGRGGRPTRSIERDELVRRALAHGAVLRTSTPAPPVFSDRPPEVPARATCRDSRVRAPTPAHREGPARRAISRLALFRRRAPPRTLGGTSGGRRASRAGAGRSGRRSGRGRPK